MNVGAGIMPQGGKIELFENGQGLQQGRALIPWAALMDFGTGKADVRALLDRDAKPLEVRLFQKPALFFGEAHDLSRDIPAVEFGEDGSQPRLAIALACPFRLDEMQVHVRQRRVADTF